MAVRRDPEIAAADRLTHQQLVDHLSEIYEELVHAYRPMAQQSKVALLGSCADAPAEVIGDRLKIKQVAETFHPTHSSTRAGGTSRSRSGGRCIGSHAKR